MDNEELALLMMDRASALQAVLMMLPDRDLAKKAYMNTMETILDVMESLGVERNGTREEALATVDKLFEFVTEKPKKDVIISKGEYIH